MQIIRSVVKVYADYIKCGLLICRLYLLWFRYMQIILSVVKVYAEYIKCGLSKCRLY